MSYGSPCMNCKRVGEVGCPCQAAMDVIKQEAKETDTQNTKTLREYAAALYYRSLEKNLIHGEPWGPEPIGLLNQEEVDTLSDLVQCKVMGSYDNPRNHINVLTQTESNNPYVGKTPKEIAESYHMVMHEVLTNRSKGKGTLVDVNLKCTPCD